MNVRELTTRFGLDVDSSAFDRADRMVGRLKTQMEGAHRNLRSLAQGMTNAGKSMTLFVTAPIAALGVGLVKVASDAEETRSKFDAVFKDLAGETRKWIDQVNKDLGRSKIDLEAWLSRLQDTFVPLGYARKDAAALSRKLTALAMDLAAFNNTSEPETIDLLTSAMVGNHEAVRRFGIVITEATLKQELLNMGLKGGVQKATEQQKAQARLNLIMKMSADAQGQAMREAKGFANQVRALKGGAKDLAAELGSYLMPIALKVVKWLRSAVAWFRNLSAGTKQIIMLIAGVVAVIGPLLLVMGLLAGTLLAVSAAWAAFRTQAMLAGNAALIAQAKIFLIPLAIMAAIALIVLLISEIYGWVKGYNSILGGLIGPWEEWKKRLQPLFDFIGGLFGGIWKIIKGFGQGIYGLFTGDMSLAAKGGALIWEGFKGAIKAVFVGIWKLIVWLGGLIFKAVVGSFKAMGRAVSGAVNSILGYLRSLIPDWLVSAWEWFVTKIEAVWKAIKNIFWGAIGVIVGLFTGDWSLIADGAALVWYGFRGVIRTIWESIKEIFGKAVAWVGETLKGIMPDFILEAWDWLTTRLAGIWETIKGIFGSAVGFISALLTGDFGAAWDALVEMAEGVLNFFIQWGDLFSDAFLGLFDSLIDGLKAVWDWIGNKIAPVVDGIVGAAKWVADKLGLGGESTTKENIANAAEEANRMFPALGGSGEGGGPGLSGAVRSEVTNRLASAKAEFQNKIEVKVEPGTPEQQKQAIGEKVRQAVKEANEQAIRDLQIDFAAFE